MDRHALAARNTAMARAMHRTSLPHLVRNAALLAFAAVPILPARGRSECERILLIRPDHLGDLLLTTPALHWLRAIRPQAELHVLANAHSAPILEFTAEVDQVLTISFPGFQRGQTFRGTNPYVDAAHVARLLRRISYTTAIILRPDHWWGALVARLAGIPERIGFAHPLVAPFLTRAVAEQPAHAVMQNAALVAAAAQQPVLPAQALAFHVQVPPDDTEYVRGYLGEWGVSPSQRVIAIHPGAGTATKQWRIDAWAHTADALMRQYDVRVVFTGSDHELPLIRAIRALMQQDAIEAAGDTNLGTLAAIYARASLVLGADSGPMHIAAAVGTPTVTLFGPADPAEFAPWGPPNRQVVLTSSIACRPCRVLDWSGDSPANHPCVHDITPLRVLDAARNLLLAASPG
jgi:heptosyltransferase-2/heptosyltransferase-3